MTRLTTVSVTQYKNTKLITLYLISDILDNGGNTCSAMANFSF